MAYRRIRFRNCRIQNSDARLVFEETKFFHITPLARAPRPHFHTFEAPDHHFHISISFLGQHSLKSVERPSYLRSDFVNLWRQARLEVFNILKYVIHLHFDLLYPTCLNFGERFCPTFLIIPRLIPIYSNNKMPMPSFKGCFDVWSLFLLRGEKDLSVDVTIKITSFEWPQITRLCI